ncbi:hypothetical protein FRC08_007229 [Ceratobasidium sp. 394]|nr:hypothetical protein FRC08_007229 [Ceratobasidium sp. 394]
MSSTSILYPVPNLADVGTILGFVTARHGLLPGVGDLFIPLMRVTFEYFWLTAAGKTLHNKFSLEAEDVATTILPAFHMLEHLHKCAPERVHEFTTASAELGAMEILARGLVLVKQEDDFDEEAKFRPLFQACNNFTSMLAMVDPALFRVNTFADAFVEWFKTLRYMRARDGMFNTRTRTKTWYLITEGCWTQAGEFLEYDELVPAAEAFSRGCMHPRCPDPNSVKGVRFECPCGQDVVYCGVRCQNA